MGANVTTARPYHACEGRLAVPRSEVEAIILDREGLTSNSACWWTTAVDAPAT